MGGACCTCSEEKKYRFKGFVVSVYPADGKGGPDEEALSKLNSYVASNPERIPRVCRKISKIMRAHLQRRKKDRVMVSVKMLRSLIEHAKTVSGFVPHSIEMCAQLLATDETRYKVGAADVLCVLCSRLSQDPEAEPSRRLIADSKDRLLPPLRAMCAVTLGQDAAGVTMAVVVQSRYAAVVAIGHLARCLNGAVAGNVSELFFPIVANLLAVLKNRAGKPVAGSSGSMESLLFPAATAPSASAPPAARVPTPTSAELPSKETDPDLAYARACVFAVGATAGCVTAAHAEPLTQRLIAFLGERGGWSIPSAPVIMFKALFGAMQERPQGLGFPVFQCLCAAGHVNADPVVRIGILRALDACVAILPMSGGRPQFILDYLRDAMRAAPVDVKDANAKPTLNAIVSCTASLLRSIHAQRNAPQLQSVLSMLLRLLSDCTTVSIEPNQASEADDSDSDKNDEGEPARDTSASGGRKVRRTAKVQRPPANASSRTYLALRCMAAAAAYVRTTPLIDRQNGALDVCSVIEPFLNNGTDAHRTWAARILRGILAGMPEGSAAGVLSTDEYDVAFAEAWVKAAVVDTTSVTPRCVVEVGSVLTAVMAAFGINALPFVLTTLWSLQNRCACGDGAVSHDPNSRNMVASTAPTSPLTRAWLHLVPAVLASCGRVYDIPKLTEYAQDILSRRQAAKPSELATCFEPALRESTRPELRYTVCGLCVTSANGAKKDVPLSSEVSLKPVSKLPSFSYVANIIVDADRTDVIAVFGATAANDLKTSIERVCFSAESEARVTLDHSDILSQAAAGAHPSELRNGSAGFALSATPRQLEAARQMQVSLVDRATSALGPRAATAAAPAGGAEGSGGSDPFASLTAGTNAGRIEEVLGKLNVGATTSLLPPDTAVSTALPLFAVPNDLRAALVARGRAHDRSLRGRQTSKSQATDGGDSSDDSLSDEGTTVSSAAGGDDAIEAQTTLAATGDALAVALVKQRAAQGDGGGAADVPARRPWFSQLPSSQYVDLE